MKKELFPHLEVGLFLEMERLERMNEQKGFGTGDFARAAHLSVRTFGK
ncbi:MAG: hypothetical protein IKA75_01620 [Bacteroidaceae bacterium]|mgnify:FL=1|nr:hypothetical protein [Bacteroidaceae bacterium]